MGLQTIGVVGAGTIGRGVAQSLAEAGFDVTLVDCSETQLARARQDIEQQLRLQVLFQPEKNRPAEEIIGRIAFETDYGALQTADFVIENVTEKWEIKHALYQRIDPICPPQAVFAANTSAISITRIAGATRRAPLVLGMHFMNPVPLMPMVEVIRGFHTSDATIGLADELLERMGKSSVVVNDAPGFVTNRVMMLTINEAIFLLQEGVASATEVDRIFKSCFGHKMGPLETADLIGLDTILYSVEVLYESYNDSKYRPCPLLKKMVDAGLHGRKTGRGFYTYMRS
jgi:3-hydroxybutyryl-CoA dehydrogenase